MELVHHKYLFTNNNLKNPEQPNRLEISMVNFMQVFLREQHRTAVEQELL